MPTIVLNVDIGVECPATSVHALTVVDVVVEQDIHQKLALLAAL